ncbi:MAG: ABC transporter permease, partial [Bacteroidota bacterium]
VLMIGGMLLFKSFISASKTDIGFVTENKLTFRIALSWFKYGSVEKKSAFFENSLRQIEAIPGVENVTLNSILPLTEMVNTSASAQESFLVEGQSDIQASDNPFVSVQRVAPNYFDAMGIGIQKGDAFDPNDHTVHSYQAIIDKNLADRMWPNGDALGKHINIWGKDSDRPLLTVIGVVDNVKHQSIMGDNIPNIYVSFYAYPHTDAHYVVQSSKPLSDLAPVLTNTILSIDENQPTFEYMPMADIVAMKNWQSKISSTLFLTIAAIGSIIAGIGLFSMMAFILLLKVKELALRRVLGATDQGVVTLVLKEMLSIAGVGILGGILLSPVLLRPIVPFLFEVDLIDISIYSFVMIVLLVASILATLMPFRSALMVNPAKVLRGD